MPGCCGIWGGVSAAWKAATGKLPPFEGCCIDHDREYVLQEIDRADADQIFRVCVTTTTGRSWASLLYYPVRALGWAPWWWRKIKDFF